MSMFNVDHLIQSGGILVISLIIFAESGLLIGFFLPGDTLLFGAGLAASQGQISLPWLIVCVSLAAIIGDNVGYSIGRRMGTRIFNKKGSILFRQDYLERSEAFYTKHGGKTIILARFVAIIRTFAPVVAGASKMPRRRFMFFNVFGGIGWAASMTLLGYWLGQRIPQLNKYIDLVLIGVVVVSFGLALFHLLKEKDTRQLIWKRFRIWLRDLSLNKKVD